MLSMDQEQSRPSVETVTRSCAFFVPTTFMASTGCVCAFDESGL